MLPGPGPRHKQHEVGRAGSLRQIDEVSMEECDETLMSPALGLEARLGEGRCRRIDERPGGDLFPQQRVWNDPTSTSDVEQGTAPEAGLTNRREHPARRR